MLWGRRTRDCQSVEHAVPSEGEKKNRILGERRGKRVERVRNRIDLRNRISFSSLRSSFFSLR